MFPVLHALILYFWIVKSRFGPPKILFWEPLI